MENIGDYLDLDKEKAYKCSDGTVVHTLDVDELVSAVRKEIGDFIKKNGINNADVDALIRGEMPN